MAQQLAGNILAVADIFLIIGGSCYLTDVGQFATHMCRENKLRDVGFNWGWHYTRTVGVFIITLRDMNYNSILQVRKSRQRLSKFPRKSEMSSVSHSLILKPKLPVAALCLSVSRTRVSLSSSCRLWAYVWSLGGIFTWHSFLPEKYFFLNVSAAIKSKVIISCLLACWDFQMWLQIKCYFATYSLKFKLFGNSELFGGL